MPRGIGVRGELRGDVGEEEGGGSYPSRGQSLAVGVGAHGQGAVEPHASVCGRVSALQGREREGERERLSASGRLETHFFNLTTRR